jgi:hypothetical protein
LVHANVIQFTRTKHFDLINSLNAVTQHWLFICQNGLNSRLKNTIIRAIIYVLIMNGKYLYQKEDNTILGPNITINFKIKQNMSYQRIYVSKLQRLTVLTITISKNISQYKLNCTVVCRLVCCKTHNNIKATFVNRVVSFINT